MLYYGYKNKKLRRNSMRTIITDNRNIDRNVNERIDNRNIIETIETDSSVLGFSKEGGDA